MKTKNEWNQDYKSEDFGSICDPLLEAMAFIYKPLVRQNEDKDFEWNGLPLGGREQACCWSPTATFKAENMAEQEEDQGRTPFEQLLIIAVQLGIEQGRRLAIEELWDNRFIDTHDIARQIDAKYKEKIQNFKDRG